MHVDAWLRRLANADDETRGRLQDAMNKIRPDAHSVLTPLAGEKQLIDAGILAESFDSLTTKFSDLAVKTVIDELGFAFEGEGVHPGNRDRSQPSESFQWLWDRVHVRRPARGGRGVVAHSTPLAPRPLELAVWAALHDVYDPEIPTISVVDLGVVRTVETGTGRVRVELLPTFVGCPAIEVMRAAVEERLLEFADDVSVEISFAEPWTSDRITPDGPRNSARLRLRPAVADARPAAAS